MIAVAMRVHLGCRACDSVIHLPLPCPAPQIDGAVRVWRNAHLGPIAFLEPYVP
jgi:hypothetical protein